MKQSILVYIITVFILGQLSSQDYTEISDANLKAMSIPSSAAFSLLGVNPEIVTKPSDVKSFKVDWRVKNYNLAPDLALEAQPMWWAYYRKKSPSAFYQMDEFQRILSTTTLSLATAKIDNVNHMAYALKFNLYKSYDPYRDAATIVESEQEIQELNLPITHEIEELSIQILNESNQDSINLLKGKIESLRFQRVYNARLKMEEFADACNNKINENWNMDIIDVAFGRVYKYDNGGLDSLKFRKAGYGIWLNAAKGIGKKGLLTGILRVNKIGGNRNYIIGAAYRVGNHKYNFFGEIIRTKYNNVIENGFDEDEVFADKLNADIGMGWYQYANGENSHTNWTMSYGGDFKLSRNILLNFALRTELTSKIKFKRFLPIANIVCLMN